MGVEDITTLDMVLAYLDARTKELGSAYDAYSFTYADGFPFNVGWVEDERTDENRLVDVIEDYAGNRSVIYYDEASGSWLSRP